MAGSVSSRRMMSSQVEPVLQRDAETIWQAGVDAVRADRLIEQRVHLDGTTLTIVAASGKSTQYDLAKYDRACIVGAGKATAGMAAALEPILAAHFCSAGQLIGWINIPNGTKQPAVHVFHHECRPVAMNEPTQAAMAGSLEILHMVKSLTRRDICFVLLSGGGSALLPLPSSGISLDDKIAATRFLSAAGADIRQLNAVRRNISQIKGGRLAKASGAGQLTTLILSDVLGDALESIASGPTVQVDDRQLARDTLATFDPQRTSIPASIWTGIENSPPATSDEQENVSPVTDNIVLGNNSTAVAAATAEAARLGYAVESHDDCAFAQPSANALGAQLVTHGQRLASLPGNRAWISGGEPTVQLAAASRRGKGGRNQQAVLQALIEWAQGEQAENVLLLSAGTDGEDGPTEAAGAAIGRSHVSQIRSSSQLLAEAKTALANNDAYPLLDQLGALFKTGLTGTNVCDVRVVLKRDPKGHS